MNEFMTVGELAQKLNVSVRTLQYYDRIGLLKPSKLSEGGRRLYVPTDIGVLHQILTLKNLGLSLEEIKSRIIPVESKEDISRVLKNQKIIIENQMSRLKKIHESISMILNEIDASEEIKWSKYTEMIQLIHEDNAYYWIVNFLEDEILNRIRTVHDENKELKVSPDWLKELMQRCIELQGHGYAPEGEVAQELAKNMWNVLNEYTKGDQVLLENMFDFFQHGDQWPEEFSSLQQQSFNFIEKMFTYYLKKSK